MVVDIRYSFVMVVVMAGVMSCSIYSSTYKALQSEGLFDTGVPYHVEKVSFQAQQHAGSDATITRTGLLLTHKDAVATILMCHGFMCDKYDIAFLRQLFPFGRYNIMTFDFRAHGEDRSEQYCTLGRDEAYDVIGAVGFLKNHPAVKDKPLLAYAFSMGAVSAIEAQAKDSSLFQAMILDCPFDSTEHIIKRSLENVKVSLFGYDFVVPGTTLLQKYAFHPYVQSIIRLALKAIAQLDTSAVNMHVFPIEPARSIEKISIPCFFIHCKNDEKVSVESIKRVFNGAAGYKTLWLTNGRRHFDSYFYNPEEYTKKARIFFDTVLQGALSPDRNGVIVEDMN